MGGRVNGRHATPAGRAALLAALLAVVTPPPSTCQVPDPLVGRIEGVVFDSTAGRPLEAADVVVWGSSHRERTAPDGTFLIPDVPTGRHTLVFFHPRLAELGISPGGTDVDVRPGEGTRVRLAVPSAFTLLAVQCALEVTPTVRADGVVPVVGRVTDGETGVPYPAARVTLSWPRQGAAPPVTLQVSTDAAGWFSACSTPAGVAVAVVADFKGRTSPRREVVLEPGEPARMDLPLSILRPAVLAGRLLDGRTGTAIGGADVALRGTALEAVTNEVGAFRLDGVPPGAHTLVVEHQPYAPREESVFLAEGRVTSVTLELSDEILALAPIEVSVEGTTLTDRAMGGFVVGREQIEKVAARVRDLADVLREQHVSGLIVRREGLGACVGFNSGQVRMHGRTGCVPVTVFIDGARAADPYTAFTIPSDAIDRMILYRPLEAGNLFGAGSANGVLEIYTRW